MLTDTGRGRRIKPSHKHMALKSSPRLIAETL